MRKKINELARVHWAFLVTSLSALLFLLVPMVMAMSFGQVAVIKPYSVVAGLFFAISALFVRLRTMCFAQVKRFFDIMVSLSVLAIFSPVVAVCALLVKILSPDGPVVYRQRRVGVHGRQFTIYKLRSMRADAEKASGAVWANAEKDPRVIPFIGEFLRKSHIDEIPQFVNVLQGQMSVVGPRPERPEFVEKLKAVIPDYEKRLNVKPGITGLAQVRHRYDKTLADVRKKVKLDLLYIRNACLMTELRILFLTLIVVVKGKEVASRRKMRQRMAA
ncbi:MAG: sugar transferase [Candidatus Omnitrophica bacterium]|nr:sugar transferase [Candidatus Omnitrophota bacterium]